MAASSRHRRRGALDRGADAHVGRAAAEVSRHRGIDVGVARHGLPSSPEDLGDHRFVNFFSAKTGRVFENEFERDGASLRITGPSSLAANDADTFVAAVVAGLGLGQIPLTAYVRSLLAAGALRAVLEGWSVPPLPIYAMWPRRRDRSARLHAFVGWVAELYAWPA
jgi:LysR family transcriptional regulator for bpeEF and oprC